MQLAAELDKLNGQVREEKEVRIRIEETLSELKSTLQATEKDKQFLQQEVQALTDALNFFRQTTCKSVHEFLNRLKLDLDLPARE